MSCGTTIIMDDSLRNLLPDLVILIEIEGVIKAFDKKGPHAGKFSVKYKDDPNWWTHSLLREGYGKDKHWVLLGLPSRDSA
jgi:hypothetical protein